MIGQATRSKMYGSFAPINELNESAAIKKSTKPNSSALTKKKAQKEVSQDNKKPLTRLKDSSAHENHESQREVKLKSLFTRIHERVRYPDKTSNNPKPKESKSLIFRGPLGVTKSTKLRQSSKSPGSRDRASRKTVNLHSSRDQTKLLPGLVTARPKKKVKKMATQPLSFPTADPQEIKNEAQLSPKHKKQVNIEIPISSQLFRQSEGILRKKFESKEYGFSRDEKGEKIRQRKKPQCENSSDMSSSNSKLTMNSKQLKVMTFEEPRTIKDSKYLKDKKADRNQKNLTQMDEVVAILPEPRLHCKKNHHQVKPRRSPRNFQSSQKRCPSKYFNQKETTCGPLRFTRSYR